MIPAGVRAEAPARTPAELPTEPVVRLDLAGASGAENMARDEELLQAAVAGAPPTLRLYRWARPTLSLGHAQTAERDCDPAALRERGVPRVRRPSGGRALLHLPDELTYAFAARRQQLPPPAAGSPAAASRVRGAYAFVMAAVAAGLSRFVRLDAFPDTLPSPTPRRKPGPARRDLRRPCQAVATGHEITAGGRKLVTGAQRWRGGAFLQHGSIPWSLDAELTNALAGLPPATPLAAVGLAGIADPIPTVREVAEAVAEAFRDRFRAGSAC